MFLPGAPCSCCGDQGPCPCQTGQLPETLTVEFKGPHGTKSQGPNLLPLEFSSCFGQGAAGFADAPGGDSKGPVSGVTLTSSGSGYAKLGRAAPTLSLANKGTQPATVTVTLSKLQDACKVDYWAVSGLTVTDGGCGFVDGEPLAVSLATGDTQEVAVSATITTTTGIPTLTATASPGNGASFEVSLESNGDDPQTWRVESVSFKGTTSGYVDGSQLTFAGPCAENQSAYTDVKVRTGRTEPSLSLSVFSWGGGTGAVLAPTVASNGGTPQTWGITAVSVTEGGSGYSTGDYVYASGALSDDFFGGFYGEVSAVDEEGAITSVAIYYGGMYYASDGIIESIEVVDGGQWYRAGVLAGVTITDGGKFYRTNASLQPYVSIPTVRIRQLHPSDGTGAVVTATVNQNTQSQDFGKLSGLTLVSGGSNYTGWTWTYPCDCEWDIDGDTFDHTVVVYRQHNIPSLPVAVTNPALQFATCAYAGFRCAADTLHSDQTIGPLCYVVLQSCIKSMMVGRLVAGIGIEGIDNSPITGVDSFHKTCGWAYLGRLALAVDRISGTASISTTVKQVVSSCGVPHWEVESVSVVDGGQGYTSGQQVTLWSSEAEQDFSGIVRPAYANQAYDQRNATGAAVVNGDGQLIGVVLSDRGKFYKESKSIPAIVPTITATVQQYLPSTGTGATLSPTVDTDPNSADFGCVTGVQVTGGGSGYLMLSRQSDSAVVVTYNGPNTPPQLQSFTRVVGAPPSAFRLDCGSFSTDDLVSNCSTLSFEAVSGDGTATVTAGGNVIPAFKARNKCCNKCDLCCPDLDITQISVMFSREASEGYALVRADHRGGFLLPFNPTGPVIEFESDKWYTECDADEAEVIFDIADLLDENHCGVLSVTRTAGYTIDPDTLIPGVTDRTVPEYTEGSAAAVTIRIFSGRFLTKFYDCVWPAFGPLSIAAIDVEVLDTLELYKLNADGGGEGKLLSEPCGKFPDSWKKTETNRISSETYQLPTGFGNFYHSDGVYISRNRPPVGANYWRQLVFSDGGFAYSLYSFPRRICKPYEVEVSFQ